MPQIRLLHDDRIKCKAKNKENMPLFSWCFIFQASVSCFAVSHFVENTLPYNATSKPEYETP